MIRRYSEPLLASYITGICAVIFIVYMVVVIIPWAVNPDNDYGVLPTFALGHITAQNDHVFVSIFFFVIALLLETVVLT